MNKTITLTLPEGMVNRLEQAAQANQRPLEDDLIAYLEMVYLPLDDVAGATQTLEQVASFSDSALWTLVDRHLTPPQEARYRELTYKHKSSENLSSDETQEHARLLHLITVNMLWRSAALAELKTRR